MSFMDRIREANTCSLNGFRSFHIEGVRVGHVRHGFAETLKRWPDVFRVNDTHAALAPDLDASATDRETRTAAVHDVLATLREEGVIDGWRDEMYPVNRHFTEPPYMLMERAAIPYFGVCAYGVHMNGFVRRDDGVHMWVARRSLTKPTGPGKLDQIVAGGQPAGIGPTANMIKECEEEAGIPPALAREVIPVGAIVYCLEAARGLRPDVIFNYDLELPADFTPLNVDGEVEEFYLWPIERVIETVHDSTAYKFNCALVVIDFLIRHGFIPPDHPDYINIVNGLLARSS